MEINIFVLKTTPIAIALVILGNSSAVMASTLKFGEQQVSERVLDLRQQVVLFKANSDNLASLTPLLPSGNQPSPLASVYFFQAMTLAGEWQPDTQVSLRETPPQWYFKPTGWKTFR
ncbi:MAG: hypothetical protein AB4041_10780 [Microcystaceae cyanobacterium]